ncbi:MAG: hypothetical protein STHCBS139747_001695 [Sporothrix thermara]
MWTLSLGLLSRDVAATQLPLSYLDFNGRAFGMQITAKAHQEALLIQAHKFLEADLPKRPAATP